MKKLIFLFLALFSVLITIAQDTTRKSKREIRRERIDELAKQEEEGIISYEKHFGGGVKLTTSGYGAFLEWGRANSVKNGVLYQFEIAENKHQKEEKRSTTIFNVPFIYGKMNYMYAAKLGAQKWINFGNKGNKNGVSVTGNFGGGLSLGILRPYEIRVGDTYISYQSDSTAFLNAIRNYELSDGPSFSNGWKNLKFVPGLYVKPAIRFDYGKYNEIISAIEIGISAEFYSKKVQQMIWQDSKQFFFSPYVALIGGKRK